MIIVNIAAGDPAPAIHRPQVLFDALGGPRRSPYRFLLAVAAVAAAAVHVPVVPQHLQEAPYSGVLFIVLTAPLLALTVAVLLRDTAEV